MNENKVSQNINNIVNDNIQALAQLFPSSVKDGELDIEALKEELGQFEEVSEEKYELTWSGKKEAKKCAQEDVINRTLQYVEKDSLHPDTTENLYIEGDNLEVLKLLRQNYYGAIKMIYIDPPYNTGNDFVYNDKFSMDKKTSDIAEGMADTDGNPLQKNQQSSNRYHANWLNMMYPRLKIAKDLLTDDGVIFISIDDNEIENLKEVCNEVFGEGNFIAEILREAIRGGSVSKNIRKVHDYILCFSKNISCTNFGGIETDGIELNLEDSNGKYAKGRELNKWGAGSRREDSPSMYYPIIAPNGDEVYPIRNDGSEGRWRLGKATMQSLLEANNAIFEKRENGSYIVYEKLRDDSNKIKQFTTWFHQEYLNSKGTEELKSLFNNERAIFDFSKPSLLIKNLSIMATDVNDTILDFFSGSATTAHAVMQLNAEDGGNRKFIMVQYPETTDEKSEAYKAGYKNICEIGKERIRRAGEQIIRNYESEMPNAKPNADPNYELRTKNYELDTGFKVFRTADTNIKWNLRDTISAMEIESSNPDTVDFTDNATDIDVVYEIMLRQRDVPLSEKIETLETIGKRTYLYASSYLICLETEITAETIEKLASLEPLPIKFVFRDSAFKDDINLKDETFRRLALLVERNTGEKKTTYTVEFI